MKTSQKSAIYKKSPEYVSKPDTDPSAYNLH